MAHAFFLGVDLVEKDDESLEAVLTILEKEKEQTQARASFRLDHARHHTESSPGDLADHLQSLVADHPYIGRTNIVVNRSAAPGQALVDALADRGLDPVAATLTGGSSTVPGETDEVGVQLGTVDAVRSLAELYRDERFVIEDHTTEATSELAREVQRVSELLDEADGNQDTPEAAGSTLEGLGDVGRALTSASLAAWCGTERSFDPSRHLKEDPQTGRAEGGAPGR